MINFIGYIVNQSKQASSWRGLIMILAAIGLVSLEQAQELGVCADIIAATFAGSGTIGLLVPDKVK